MITGVHALLYSKNAEADRAFFRDVLGLRFIDSGGGWLIFALPPAELGIHPTEEEDTPELYLLCDDVEQTIAELKSKNVECSPIREFDWGRLTVLTLPSGSNLGMYQPKHPVAAA